MKTKIFIGNDHHGRDLKKEIVENFSKNYDFIDCGTDADSADHPIFAEKVAKSVVSTPGSLGILICGSGVGMSIAANKIAGARCGLANTVELARGMRAHNGANILALGANFFHRENFTEIVKTFLETEISIVERYVRRRKMIDEM